MMNAIKFFETTERMKGNMKKTAITLLAVIAAAVMLFTGCSRNTDKDMTTTKAPVTTTAAATTAAATTDRDLTNDIAGTSAGAPESTNRDSALGDAVEDAAEGAADANERIAQGVRDAQNNNR